MKRYLKLITICLTSIFISIWTSCMATVVELPSGESEENVNYVDSYEEYENIIGDTTNGYNQDDLAKLYEDYRNYMKEYYKSYKREETVRAKVIKTEDVKAQYEIDEYYYSTSKYEIQPITIEIMEGEYIGQKFSMDYLLTGDSLNNIKYSELKVGDKIFVTVYTNEESDELVADITNAGSNIERFGTVFCIGIIAIVLLIIYGGKKGLLTSLITLLILDFCLVIIPNMGFEGQGFIAGALLIALLIFTISISKLGFNKKAFKASCGASLIVIITGIILGVFSYLTRTVGVTFEAAALSENVIMGNINFETLYMIVTLIIASVAITNVACSCVKKLENTQVTTFNEKLDACKDVLGGNVLLVVISLIALYIPNHLLLLTNKYTDTEILNAEILVTELIRVFTIIIAMSLTVPTFVFFDKKKD